MTHLVLVIIFSLLIFAAGASFLLMIFPAHLFLLIISLVFGLIDHFEHLRVWEWGILCGVAVVMIIVDYASGLLGAKIAGASKKSVLWGIVGLVIGLIIFPPFGSLIGLFLGILLYELINFKEYRRAIKSATGSLLGVLLGTFLNLALALVFLVLFIVFALK